MIAGLRLLFFKIHIKYVVFMSVSRRPAILRFWFQTDLRRKNSASFLKIQAGKTFSYHGHGLVTLHVQFLCSDWLKLNLTGEFMRKIYKSCLLWQLKLTEFASTCDVFNCLFPLDVQNEIQLLSKVFSYSWLVCLLGSSLRNASLVKAANPKFGWHRFCFSPCWVRMRIIKAQAILALLNSFQELHLEIW